MIKILQPLIPHYRKEFIAQLAHQLPVDIYCYERSGMSKKKGFNVSENECLPISAIQMNYFLVYNPFPLLRKSRIMVLMLHPGHLSTWLLLLTKRFHNRKIILWGHGISVRNYIKEEKYPSRLKKWMINLSDHCWFYTDKELNIWKSRFPKISATSLTNTLSNVEAILLNRNNNKPALKEKYNITNKTVFIYCARFSDPERRAELLVNLIKKLDSKTYGFIIIGEGKFKPDFTEFKNVYDFNSLYDDQTKSELFGISDLYLQPAYLGLSVVEALAYGKPVVTLDRSEENKQGVEFGYLKDEQNALICKDESDMIDRIVTLTDERLVELSDNALAYANSNLRLGNMINKAVDSLKSID